MNFTAFYNHDGSIDSVNINYEGELMKIIPCIRNGPTRELQRADEVVQALIKLKNEKTNISNS